MPKKSDKVIKRSKSSKLSLSSIHKGIKISKSQTKSLSTKNINQSSFEKSLNDLKERNKFKMELSNSNSVNSSSLIFQPSILNTTISQKYSAMNEIDFLLKGEESINKPSSSIQRGKSKITNSNIYSILPVMESEDSDTEKSNIQITNTIILKPSVFSSLPSSNHIDMNDI
jgi:hypothetical protein